jgi:hypothetical protein
MQRLGLPVCSLRVDRNHFNETGRLYDRQKLNKEIFMVAIRPVPSTNQLAHLLASGPKGPIDVPMPLRDGFPPPTNNNGGKRPTQFPDPDNRHIFLVPPRDNNQPELELDSGKRDAKPLTFQERKGYQDVADLFPNVIYEGQVPEAAHQGADGTATVCPNATEEVRHLGLRGAASGEYLVSGDAGCLDNITIRESVDLFNERGAMATTSPKGESSNEIASISLAPGRHASPRSPYDGAKGRLLMFPCQSFWHQRDEIHLVDARKDEILS